MEEKHIYIDESGSLKNTKSCVICFIVFDNTSILNKISKNIETFKLKKFKNLWTELHFNRESFVTKKIFFKILNRYKLKIYYYQSNYLDKNLTYNELMLKSILVNIEIFKDSKIYIDGVFFQNNTLINSVKNLFKKNNIKGYSIKIENSKNSLPIQISDMCAGCIRRRLDRGNKEDIELYYLIRKFIQ